MDPFLLNDDRRALRDLARRLTREVYAPLAREWDEAGTPFPNEERRRLGSLGLLGITLPQDCGGAGAPLLDALLVIEEFAKGCHPAAFQVFESNTGPARVIDLFGSEAQRRRLLPPIIAGEATMAVAISEPDAGSAATDLALRARRDGDHFVLDGTKRWCSGAGHAEQYLVYARLEDTPGARGIGALVVDRDVDGLRFGPREALMGFRCIPSADMTFDAVRVPADNLIVEAGGFGKLFTAFSIERLGNATMSLALGQTCLDRTAEHIRERRQFGRELMHFQSVQVMLADMIMQVEATRLLIWRAAEAAGHGAPSPLDASIAKCYANEMAKHVSDLAMQLHGGYGYSAEYDLERHHRDAHGWALAGGTPTMQRLRIAAEYLGQRFSQRG